ncbi:hypothetical protein [Clostridium tagluense]|uniref:hypothetical protein n=1 Tax=Clostridium tagluense TaxID=360422 RepID=UPI001CF409D4|nr:hypothetical protein [Clostridium tagluense]MCB2296827.1 hypothetical protein [Clostridium tagluense]
MKVDKKNYKKIIISLVVIILVIILFFFLNKSKDNKVNSDNKEKSTKSAINTEESKKKDGEAAKGKTTTNEEKAGEKVTSETNKDTKEGKKVAVTEGQKDKATKVTNKKEGFSVFVKAGNFGSIAEILMDSTNDNTSYKYYQFFLGNKAISNIVSITKNETTIFPDQKAGNEVVLKLLGENKKVIKELKIILNDK